MGRVRFTPELIIGKLREAGVLRGQGMDMVKAIHMLGVSAQTYFLWRKEYDRMCGDQVRRLKEPEAINAG